MRDVFLLLASLGLLLEAPRSHYLPHPDLVGEVLDVHRTETNKLPDLLVRGETFLTRRTWLHLDSETRIWKIVEGERRRARASEIRGGAQIEARFVGHAALLTYPLQARALSVLVLPGPASKEPIRVGSRVLSSHLEKRVEPRYPPEARGSAREGVVLLEVTLDREGNVERARLLRGHPLFN